MIIHSQENIGTYAAVEENQRRRTPARLNFVSLEFCPREGISNAYNCDRFLNEIQSLMPITLNEIISPA